MIDKRRGYIAKKSRVVMAGTKDGCRFGRQSIFINAYASFGVPVAQLIGTLGRFLRTFAPATGGLEEALDGQ